MSKYTKVLLAVDLAADNAPVIDRAKQVVADDDAELYLIHVHEPSITAYQAGGMTALSSQTVSLDAEVRKVAEHELKALADSLKIPATHTFMPFGKASSEIKRAAEENDIDLIIIGTHGRSGIGLLLGSTANGVLHGVECDVLSVRTGD